METRSWRWFQSKVSGLLDRPISHDWLGNPLFASRLQARFFTPPAEGSAKANR